MSRIVKALVAYITVFVFWFSKGGSFEETALFENTSEEMITWTPNEQESPLFLAEATDNDSFVTYAESYDEWFIQEYNSLDE